MWQREVSSPRGESASIDLNPNVPTIEHDRAWGRHGSYPCHQPDTCFRADESSTTILGMERRLSYLTPCGLYSSRSVTLIPDIAGASDWQLLFMGYRVDRDEIRQPAQVSRRERITPSHVRLPAAVSYADLDKCVAASA